MKKRFITLVLALVLLLCLGLMAPVWAAAVEQDHTEDALVYEPLCKEHPAADQVLWIEHDGSTGTTRIVGGYCPGCDKNRDKEILESPPYNPEETAVQ